MSPVDGGDWCWHNPRCRTLEACDQKRQEQFDADLEAGRKSEPSTTPEVPADE